MGRIAICGGGPIGLLAGMLLARAGHAVTVLEADPAEPPADPRAAWENWARPGVAQFRQPHNLLPRFQRILEVELPDLTERLLAAGCLRKTELVPLPPSIVDRTPRPDDDRFEYVTGRRPVVEAVFAAAASVEPGVVVRRGTKVDGLVSAGGVVSGVRLATGETLRADLVVDAMGRRSPSSAWLVAAGAKEPVNEVEAGGFSYYSRFYRGPRMPDRRAAPFTPLGTFSLLTLPADNGTWSVTVVSASGDAPLKVLRDADRFERLVSASPAHAQWLAGEPITDIVVMAGVLDRYRRFVLAGRPLVTGFAAIGDAWACTNPTASRGLTIGLMHAQQLRDVVRDHGGDPLAWDGATEDVLTPFYRDQVRADRARVAEMDALRRGDEPPSADPAVARFEAAAMTDADVFRALLESAGGLAPFSEIVTRPGVKERIDAVAPGAGGRPGPNRAQLLDLLAG